MVQWLGLHTVIAKGWGSIPGQGANISQATQHSQKKKKKKKIKIKNNPTNNQGFPGGSLAKNLPASAVDRGGGVWFLIREHPTHHGATKPVPHDYWAMLWSPGARTAEAGAPTACAPQWRRHCNEKPVSNS